MNYSPKLKKAIDEIKVILTKHDIAGSIVLHTPGFSEFLLHLTPTYSCCMIDHTGIRIRARIKEDFNGDTSKWEWKVKNTTNMLHHLGTVHAEKILTLLELSEKLDKETDAKYFGGGSTSHDQQNN